jgi:hypothetical protein
MERSVMKIVRTDIVHTTCGLFSSMQRRSAVGLLCLTSIGAIFSRATEAQIVAKSNPLLDQSEEPTVNHYANIAAMRALSKASLSNNQQVLVGGHTSIGDGGGGTFYWDQAATTTANGGTVFTANEGGTGRWKRIYDGAVNIRWFGARGDNVANDAPAIQAACNASKHVFIPPGRFKITSAITVGQAHHIFGAGYLNSMVEVSGAIKGFVWESATLAEGDIELRDFRIRGTSSALDLVSFKNVTVGRLYGMNIRNSNKNCIKLDTDCIDWLIQKCVIETFSENGIWLKQTSSVNSIRDCTFNSNDAATPRNCVLVSGVEEVVIDTCNVNANNKGLALLGVGGANAAGRLSVRNSYAEFSTAPLIRAYANGATLPDGSTQSGNALIAGLIVENCTFATSNSLAIELSNGAAHVGVRIHNVNQPTIRAGGFVFDPGLTADWEYTGGGDLSRVPANNIVGAAYQGAREARKGRPPPAGPRSP